MVRRCSATLLYLRLARGRSFGLWTYMMKYDVYEREAISSKQWALKDPRSGSGLPRGRPPRRCHRQAPTHRTWCCRRSLRSRGAPSAGASKRSWRSWAVRYTTQIPTTRSLDPGPCLMICLFRNSSFVRDSLESYLELESEHQLRRRSTASWPTRGGF